MLRAVRSGMNIRQAGQQFRFPKSTVAYWVQRTYGERLDRVDLANRKPGRASNRTAFDVEQRIAQLRIDLRESVLGEYGAGAIRTALQAEMARVPSEASVNRVLARLGLQDDVRRIRRPAPPKHSSLTRMRRCMATSSSFAAAMRADTFISLVSVSP